jgi:hypothetical protein
MELSQRGKAATERNRPLPPLPEGVKKLLLFLFTSFRRKPESSVFQALRIDWTPVFTGVTAEIQFFHTFPPRGGRLGWGDAFGKKNRNLK